MKARILWEGNPENGFKKEEEKKKKLQQLRNYMYASAENFHGGTFLVLFASSFRKLHSANYFNWVILL